MTTHVQIYLVKQDTTLKATYRGQAFRRIELVKGKLQPEEIKAIGKIVPPTLDRVDAFTKAFAQRVTYTKLVKEKSLFSQFNEAWFTFFESFHSFPPKFNGADGKALKQIIASLKKITGTEEDALVIFKALLDHWHQLPKFHQDHTDLRYINSQLNILLSELKKHTANSFNNTMQGATASSFKFK